MLVQSHNGFIHILPALPDNWNEGSFEGLRVRDGAEVDAVWADGKLTSLVLLAQVDNIFELVVPEYVSAIYRDKREIQSKDGFISIEMKKGEIANLVFKSF